MPKKMKRVKNVFPLQSVRHEDYYVNEPHIEALDDLTDIEDEEEGEEVKYKEEEHVSPQVNLSDIHIENVKDRLYELKREDPR